MNKEERIERMRKRAIELRAKELKKLSKKELLIRIILDIEDEFSLLGTYLQARKEVGLE